MVAIQTNMGILPQHNRSALEEALKKRGVQLKQP